MRHTKCSVLWIFYAKQWSKKPKKLSHVSFVKQMLRLEGGRVEWLRIWSAVVELEANQHR